MNMSSVLSNYSNILNTALFIVGFVIFLSFLFISKTSFFEKEYRAYKISLITSFLVLISFTFLFIADFNFKDLTIFLVLVTIFIAVLFLFLPIQRRKNIKKQIPIEKHDERDIMFSRNELIPGTEKYNEYYFKRPEKKEPDDLFRKKPGLLSPEASMFEPVTFAAANANLEVIETLKKNVQGKISETQIKIDSKEISRFIKNWSKKLGAHTVGITNLKDYHLYSYKGRGELYGKEITNQHPNAIAVTVEMNHEIMQTAPQGPVIMESTRQYLNSGTIAVQIANFIRNLGYSARAHIDGNYELICPLVARDAGLGEIGRMGLLMTPKLGPRIRIAVITTDLPLEIDKTNNNSSTIDFCSICKKCADNCPSKSISFNDREKICGVLRWKINSESCFTYWCTIGTDCGRCMSVCPYSHPNNLMHNFIRWGIKNSYIFRRFALIMDDVFYRRKPKNRKIPSWIDK